MSEMPKLLSNISCLCTSRHVLFRDVCKSLNIDQKKFICGDDITEVEDEVKMIADYFKVEERILYIGMRSKGMEYRKRQILFYNIEELAKRRGISISTLCREAEIPESRIHGWETGVSSVVSGDIERIARYFGITAEDLLSKECLNSTTDVRSDKQDKIYKEVLDTFGISAHDLLEIFNSMSNNDLRAAALECVKAIKAVEAR